MAHPIYVSKALIAASSSGLGSISTAATPVVTLKTSSLDTQRRVSLSATADFSATFTITGTRQGGTILTEIIRGSTAAGAVATTNDFLTVSSILVSSGLANGVVQIGTNTNGGSPWQEVNIDVANFNIGFALTYSSTSNSMQAQLEYTLDDVVAWNVSQYPIYPQGGAPTPINNPPAVFTSTTISTTGGPSHGVGIIPFWGWRMTLTSSSSGAGSANMTAIQAGIG